MSENLKQKAFALVGRSNTDVKSAGVVEDDPEKHTFFRIKSLDEAQKGKLSPLPSSATVRSPRLASSTSSSRLESSGTHQTSFRRVTTISSLPFPSPSSDITIQGVMSSPRPRSTVTKTENDPVASVLLEDEEQESEEVEAKEEDDFLNMVNPFCLPEFEGLPDFQPPIQLSREEILKKYGVISEDLEEAEDVGDVDKSKEDFEDEYDEEESYEDDDDWEDNKFGRGSSHAPMPPQAVSERSNSFYARKLGGELISAVSDNVSEDISKMHCNAGDDENNDDSNDEGDYKEEEEGEEEEEEEGEGEEEEEGDRVNMGYHIVLQRRLLLANRYQVREEDLASQLTEHDKIQGLKMLPVKVQECDGGQYSSVYAINNVLRPNDDVYCSKRARNINLYLSPVNEFLEKNELACITDVVVIVPKDGFTSPLMDGLIFISDKPIEKKDHAKYDNYTLNEFETLWNRVENGIEHPGGSLIPVAFFHVLGCFQNKPVTVKLKSGMPCSHILVKFIRPEGEGSNIDVRFIGFKGFYETALMPCEVTL
eukprot:m.136007 g.136007  ORF g.136007 m.136007 type:complete len:538 (+) comp10349_c0_seq1:168-1781(+)